MNRRVPRPIVALIVTMHWLQSCAPEPPASPRAITVAPADAAQASRRVEILRQIRAICPTPMTAAELTAAADHLEAHPEDQPLVRRLDLFDRQSRICRGEQ